MLLSRVAGRSGRRDAFFDMTREIKDRDLHRKPKDRFLNAYRVNVSKAIISIFHRSGNSLCLLAKE